jgi:hypothetical protein
MHNITLRSENVALMKAPANIITTNTVVSQKFGPHFPNTYTFFKNKLLYIDVQYQKALKWWQ